MKMCLLYIKKQRKIKNSYAKDVISRQVEKVMIRDIKREIYRFFFLTEKVILHFKNTYSFTDNPNRNIASSTL